MTWDDLTAEERLLTDSQHALAVLPLGVVQGAYIQAWTWVLCTRHIPRRDRQATADQAAAVAAVRALAAGNGKTPGDP